MENNFKKKNIKEDIKKTMMINIEKKDINLIEFLFISNNFLFFFILYFFMINNIKKFIFFILNILILKFFSKHLTLLIICPQSKMMKNN